MESVDRILKRAAAARPVFDLLWEEWTQSGKWPPSRAVWQRIGEERVRSAVNRLNDAYLMECEPSHDTTYELRLFGVLAMSREQEWLGLLTRFVEFLRAAFQADPARQKNFTNEEVARYSGMSADEAMNLGRLLSFHPFEMMNLGYGSPAFVGWECGIPKGFYEIGQPGDARRKLESILVRRYQPRLPVGLDDRRKSLTQMAAAAASGDPWAEVLAPAIGFVQRHRRGSAMLPRARKKPATLDFFISHSTKDQDLASAVIDLLIAAFRLKPEQIRCTSVAGTKLPVGVRTDDQIQEEIRSAAIFIALLTPASLRSAYVLVELGARWLSGGPLAGLYAKGASGSSRMGPISGFNMLLAHSEIDLGQYVRDIGKARKQRPASPRQFSNVLKRVSEVSRAGDPFVKYQGIRVKIRGQQNKEQYFVNRGRTHYVEVSAAQVCENVGLACTSIEPEEAEVLFSTLDDPLNAVQMQAVLSALGKDVK